MFTLTDLSSVLTSLKVAGDMAQALVGLRDSTLIDTKVVELQRQIIAAQQSAFAANTAQFAQLKRIDELEKDIARLETWQAETEKCELKEVKPGAFAYALKEQTGGTEPHHCLCPNCYEDSRKSVLQRLRMPGAIEVLHCLRCGSDVNLTGVLYAHPRPISRAIPPR